MISIRLSEDAINDLEEGFDFYEMQEPGLGSYFLACIEADIERLGLYAGSHRKIYQEYYRALSKIFPFGLFYSIEDGVGVVWAVIDLRKHPAWIRQKLIG